MYYTDDSDSSFYGQFLTYKIVKGDTLQSVSKKLGIEIQELRRYHNMHCKLSDLIEGDFKRHSKFLILSPEKSQIESNVIIEKQVQKVILGKDNKLPFLPRGISKEYSVKYTFEVGDKIDETEMAVGVKWIATNKNKYHLFEINRTSDIYINGRVPDAMMDELAIKTSEVLYPLKIVVDEFGEWIDIYNFSEVERRWDKSKSEILDYYDGEIVEAYIDETEYALENSERLWASLRSDYFLRTFFIGIYIQYTADYEFQNDLLFPLEEETESVFSVQHKIAPNVDDAGLIKIEQKGHYVDSGYGFLYGYASSKVNYDAVYFLNSDTYVMEQIKLECNIENYEPMKTTIAIELSENKKDKK